ncbi:ATPase (AAA+ superfamily)-like protein [Lentisphaera araneosa HTCC2155]|uniref:ATPase (AAA+ superfamily)-like protein n=1 Tax=Lentisphaera araneosa HTCC2155 TaxID=313628 RepID=A6DT28_9BACT|nr:ATP-binding protein [Lentisphaera araneosa]EDM25203.1 ATPase (AAA+ superfamily)-like protein [Lentisphaera araneosa HTCC2155]
MIKRAITSEFHQLCREFPVVTILGPRQAGKTTLAKVELPSYDYSNLEDPETRALASEDPKAYLAQFKGKLIIDEIQRVPHLLSYIQVIIDQNKIMGQYVLTGSHQLELKAAISQSLAGRTAIIKLLPFSISELEAAGIAYESFEEYSLKGFLPQVYDRSIRPYVAYSNYYQTYVERDVRQLIKLKDQGLFEKFMKLLAGRAGQIMDYSSLANDLGVSQKTIKDWLSILEASFIIYKLPPYYNNFGKRAIKSSKYYFIELGLLCFLLGIKNRNHLQRDPLVGSIFENLVVLEFLKYQLNQGSMDQAYFFRDSNGNEVDLLININDFDWQIEVKSASTYASKQLKSLVKMRTLMDAKSLLVYNGDSMDLSDNYYLRNFKELTELV